MTTITFEMDIRTAILTRDAIRWYVEEQSKRRKKLPADYDPEILALALSHEEERLAGAQLIDDGITKWQKSKA